MEDLNYNFTFEVLSNGDRFSFPIDELSSIRETPNGIDIVIVGEDDKIPVQEDYDMFKIRYEKALSENRILDKRDFNFNYGEEE